MGKVLYCRDQVFIEQLDEVALELFEQLQTPALVILEGPVGAGKTTFAKCFGERLKSLDKDSNIEVLSPTYSIINEMTNFVHADFYRIQKASELTHLEFSLYVEDKDFIFVEWGKAWLNELIRMLDGTYFLYELNIQMLNYASDNHSPIIGRKFQLSLLP